MHGSIPPRAYPLRGRRPVGLLLAAFVALFLAAGSAWGDDPTVIVLSWDGVRHDYLDRADFPALGRMEREGARAERLVPVFPSSTFPNHVALATGTHVDRHGILGNRFLDRERGMHVYENDASWIEAEPLWAAAERQGVAAAAFFWVGSETDWNGVGARYRRAPFDASVGEQEKVDQILAWLDLPEEERPRLVMSWWHGADTVGHRKGPEHADIVTQLYEQDAALAALFAGLDERDAWGDTTVFLVSDHGMTEVSEPVDARAPLEAAGIGARVIRGSALAWVFLDDPADLERAERALGSLGGVRVYRRDAIPEEWRIRHPTRNGDLLLVTDPPRTFYQPSTTQALLRRLGRWLGWRSGMHGYDPEHPDMGAVFLALGRGVPAGLRLGAVSNLDVAPTVSKLLGIQPPAQSEGRPIPGIGVPVSGDAVGRRP